MNERIRELAEKSGAATMLFNKEGHYFVVKPELEKFAELIIRECAQFVEDKFDFCGDEIIIAEEVRKQFGVEE